MNKEYCKLVYIDKAGKETLIDTGRWALMQQKRKQLMQDAFYRGKTLKLKYYDI